MKPTITTRLLATAGGLAVLSFVGAAPASSQLHVGAKAGMSVSRFAGGELDESTWKRGLAGGVFATYGMVEELSFQTEAFYQQKGAEVRHPSAGIEAGTFVNLDYVELAAMLRMDIRVPVGTASLYGVAGPGVSVNVRCTTFMGGDGGDVEGGCADIDMDVRTLDFNMVAGGGLSVMVNGAAVFVEGRFGIGLVTIDAGTTGWGRTNEAFALLAGLSFQPGGGRSSSAMR
ncbi:MAG: PorT family protein [Gemmatimonadetes bacterium]|nr:PorT family protein [Gemmatimonadota bacterium]